MRIDNNHGFVMSSLVAIGTAVGGALAAGAGLSVGAVGIGASIGGIVGAGAGLAAYGGLAYAAYKGLTGKGQKQITGPAQGQSPGVQLQEAEKAAAIKAEQSQTKRRTAMARQKTVHTSPLGLTEQASTAQKTLTGQ